MTDQRDLCAVCETALLPDDGHRCARCEAIVIEWNVEDAVERMRAAAREHLRLVRIVSTLLGCHEPKEPKR